MNQRNIVLFLALIVAAVVIIIYSIPNNSSSPTITPTILPDAVNTLPKESENITRPNSITPVPPQPVKEPAIEASSIEIIKIGTSFGECVRYCKKELEINSRTITYTKSGWDTSYPEVKKDVPISADKWNGLIALLETKKFNLLPDVIGCPDCADGGAEWIEIFDGKINKKVEFEFGASISEIDPFLIKLREIRKDILSQFDE